MNGEEKKGEKVQKERSFEIGMDEGWKTNFKRLFDEFLQESLDDIRKSGTLFERMMLDNHAHIGRVQIYAEQCLRDSLAHAKNLDSRTVLHLPTSDVAHDRTWNFIDELSASLHAKTGVEQDAVMALLIKALTEMLAPSVKAAAEAK